jgi:hypothetical protein
MIPSLDSPNYLPMIEPQNTELAASGLSSSTAIPITATTTSAFYPEMSARKTPRGPSMSQWQKLFDAISRMLQALALVLQQRNAMKSNTSPASPGATTPQPEMPGSTSNTPWLAPVDQEPSLAIPDLDPPTTPALPDQATPINPPDNPGTTEPTAPPGASLLPIDSLEEIPNLSDVQQPALGTKQYNVGTRLRGSGQFLWKPVSDKDGKLAVLIPPKLTGKVKSLVIISPDKTKILGKGKFSGIGNGDREHFRFSKAGGQYPDKAIVMITLKDDSTQYVTIRNTSARYTQ